MIILCVKLLFVFSGIILNFMKFKYHLEKMPFQSLQE